MKGDPGYAGERQSHCWYRHPNRADGPGKQRNARMGTQGSACGLASLIDRTEQFHVIAAWAAIFAFICSLMSALQD